MSFRSTGEQVLDQTRAGLGKFVRLSHFMHEANPGRLVGAKAFCAEKIALRLTRADCPQSKRRDHSRDNPQPHFRESKHRRRAGNRDIASCDQANTAANRCAIDQSDGGFGTLIHRLQHGGEAQALFDIFLLGIIGNRLHHGKIRPGREGFALAGQPLTF